MPRDRGEYYRQNKHIWQRSYLKNKEKRLAASRHWRMRNKEQARKYGIEYGRKLKVECLTHYGNGFLCCTRCGFSDIRALSIDHINGKGAEHRRNLAKEGKTGKTLYKWLKDRNYPKGYQTLCMNCQYIKRQENKECPGIRTLS